MATVAFVPVINFLVDDFERHDDKNGANFECIEKLNLAGIEFELKNTFKIFELSDFALF